MNDQLKERAIDVQIGELLHQRGGLAQGVEE